MNNSKFLVAGYFFPGRLRSLFFVQYIKRETVLLLTVETIQILSRWRSVTVNSSALHIAMILVHIPASHICERLLFHVSFTCTFVYKTYTIHLIIHLYISMCTKLLSFT
jgi:hypothetical protein